MFAATSCSRCTKPKAPAIIVSVRELDHDDISKLEPILRQHIRHPGTNRVIETEVRAVMGYMAGNADDEQRLRKFFVATDKVGMLLGCIAISTPDVSMKRHFQAEANVSAELLNAFVTAEHYRGKGIGRRLFELACAYAKQTGAQRLLVNSGLRYESSWGFYDKVCDSSHGIIQNKYGPGRHAKTWSKAL